MNRLIKSHLLAGIVGMGLLTLGSGTAHAHIFPTFLSNGFDGTGYKYTYDMQVDANEKVQKGDYFTFYDMAGYINGTEFAPSADWVFSKQNLGIDAPMVSVPDSNSIVNLTWTYMGSSILGPSTDLGNFGADSVYVNHTTGWSTSYAHDKLSTPTHVIMDGNYDHPEVPVAPEPCTMAVLGLGAAPLLGGLRRRFRKA